jgi:hypothetical protein
MRIIPGTQNLIDKISNDLKVIFSKRYPVYVFHHIPKCGGQSVLQVLRSWFILVEDYRSESLYKKPADLSKLRTVHCLCGHFALEGYHICDRYPQIYGTDQFRLFTFLREPLQAKLSLYRYEKEHYDINLSLEEHLLTRNNYLASIFPVTMDNYQDVLDKYFFVGIIEEAQASMDVLASLLNKPRQAIPWINKTNQGNELERSNIPVKFIEKFQQENQLDYALYHYARQRYEKMTTS